MTSINVPFTFATGTLSGGYIDPQNVSGKKLAEIGRAVLGMSVKGATPDSPDWKQEYEAQYTDAAWLDQRVDEICKRGRI